MARNKVVETISAEELEALRERAAQAEELSHQPFAPEKLVIVAGTSFGTAFKFLLLGVAIGAGVATLLQGKSTASRATDALNEGLSGGGAKASTLTGRIEGLAGRVKNLAGRAKDAAQSVAHNVQPALESALSQAKQSDQSSDPKSADEMREELTREPS